jgi:truncated hemoglobin YjbI
MVIQRERYLDDGGSWHLALSLGSRSLPAHTLLTALSVEERDRVATTLTRALDEVTALLREKMAREGTTSRR